MNQDQSKKEDDHEDHDLLRNRPVDEKEPHEVEEKYEYFYPATPDGLGSLRKENFFRTRVHAAPFIPRGDLKQQLNSARDSKFLVEVKDHQGATTPFTFESQLLYSDPPRGAEQEEVNSYNSINIKDNHNKGEKEEERPLDLHLVHSKGANRVHRRSRRGGVRNRNNNKNNAGRQNTST